MSGMQFPEIPKHIILFINAIEKHYGVYKKSVRLAVTGYLYEEKFTVMDLKRILKRLKRTYSTQWDKVPDAPVIEKARKEIKLHSESDPGYPALDIDSCKILMIEARPSKEEQKLASKFLKELAESLKSKREIEINQKIK